MLRFHPIANAQAAISYFAMSDGGYYAGQDDLRTEWGGNASKLLWLSAKPDFEQFKSLIQGYDPHSGEQLTAALRPDRIPGWDITASIPKGVTLALEHGDERIHQALWEANREAMADLEGYATTRVRKGGAYDDRKTGNLVWYSVEHAETRPAKGDRMPDPDRHIHNVLMNITYDGEEGEWKAVKFRKIMDYRKYFDRRFDLRLSSKLADLGYGIETKYRPDDRGGQRYYSWDIHGVPESLILKNSRRSQEVEALAADLGVGTALGKDKLGATSRLFKRKDLSLADLREYWQLKTTPDEGQELASTIARSITGQNPRSGPKTPDAVRYALEHEFSRQSVADWHAVAVTAMERSMGTGNPDLVMAELKRQGLLVKGDEATTKKVLAQERRIIGFARQGRASLRPLVGVGDLSGLSDEQVAAIQHVWNSTDSIILIRGGAGTGKTTLMKKAIGGIRKPVAVLAPSTDASRVVLRQEGFAEANTVAAFLNDEKWQESVRDGVIWVDEAGLLQIDDLERLCQLAEELNARLVLQGDPRQHRSVLRHGNMLTVLETLAGLPVAELKTIRRQQGKYAEAVEAIRDGDYEKGVRGLHDLGWIVEGGHALLAREYERALRRNLSVTVIDPTHRDADLLTERLRKLRKGYGLITGPEDSVLKLTQLGWSEAEKRDRHRYQGDEVIYFFKRHKRWKAGEQVKASEVLGDLPKIERFGVYQKDEIRLAPGDVIRMTGSIKAGGKTIDSGSIETVERVTPDEIVLAGEKRLPRNTGLIDYGLVQTSFAAQGKTSDVVLASMTGAAAGAIGAEQAYVSASRGKKAGMIFTDMRWDELLRHIHRKDDRVSAVEWLKQKKALAEKRKRVYKQWVAKRDAMAKKRERKIG